MNSNFTGERGICLMKRSRFITSDCYGNQAERRCKFRNFTIYPYASLGNSLDISKRIKQTSDMFTFLFLVFFL